jgi:hypothetical protein
MFDPYRYNAIVQTLKKAHPDLPDESLAELARYYYDKDQQSLKESIKASQQRLNRPSVFDNL